MTVEEGAMDPLKNSVSEVLRATGHQSPELGGGAASILAALIGLSLVRLAVATTGERTEHPMDAGLARLDALSRELEDLAREDVAVFRQYVAALQLPHETQGEERQRDKALQDSGHDAAETPLSAARLIAEGLEIAADAAAAIHPEVTSDIYAGAAILNGAFVGSIATLDINLKPQRMEGERDALLARRDATIGDQKRAMEKLAGQADADGFFLG
jgi:formiminotetrahydrofolate cyclodeaminase